MRGTEVLLLVLTCAAMARVLTPLRPRRGVALATALVTAAVFAAHLALQGPRWQLVPLYVVSLAAVGVAVADWMRPCDPTRRRAPAVCATLFALLGAAIGWALPVAELAEPEGPYPVGTVSATIVDSARDDPYRDGEQPRRLALQVWYPAADEGGSSPWIERPGVIASAAASWLEVPDFALSHLGLVTSHATHGARMAEGTGRPLVVYAHGWSGFRNVQSTQLESLASHGYVVAAVDHAPAALASSYPDGDVVPLDPSALPEQAPEAHYERASRRLMETFADDLATVVAHVRGLEVLDGRLSSDTVAMIGHSTGGGAAILACARERRCSAVVAYDPWVEPLPDDVIGRGLDRPLLSMRSDEWVDTANDRRLRRLHAASHEGSAPIAITGAAHSDFTLLPLLTPLASRVGLSGPTGGDEVHRIVDDWTLAFLDHHVRERPTDPVAAPPDHDAVSIDRPLDDG